MGRTNQDGTECKKCGNTQFVDSDGLCKSCEEDQVIYEYSEMSDPDKPDFEAKRFGNLQVYRYCRNCLPGQFLDKTDGKCKFCPFRSVVKR